MSFSLGPDGKALVTIEKRERVRGDILIQSETVSFDLEAIARHFLNICYHCGGKLEYDMDPYCSFCGKIQISGDEIIKRSGQIIKP